MDTETQLPEADDAVDAYLQSARELAEAGTPVSTSIRSLVAQFGAARRGARVARRIQTELDRHGLASDPPFESEWIDTYIVLKLANIPTSTPRSAGDSAEAALPAPVALTVGSLESANLKSAGRAVAHIDRNKDLAHARALMLSNNFSQLAVTSGGTKTIVGAVSWESMAKAALRKADFSLADATIRATTVALDDNLISLVPAIVELGFVFVVAKDKELHGIVTTADLGSQFASLAKPFFLLGEVERRLRHVINAEFTVDELSAVHDPSDKPREISSAADLTLGEMQRLLEPEGNWNRLDWPVDRAIFGQQLNAVREIRNDVMHFGPDPLDLVQLETLENLITWLQVHDPH